MSKPKETFEQQIANFMNDVYLNKVNLSENAPLDEVEDELTKPQFGTWISVGDRLPENFSRILMFSSTEMNRESFSGDYNNTLGGFFNDEGLVMNDVTHWMPLPPNPTN